MIAKQGITFDATREAKAYLAEKGYNPEYGARPIKREIRDVVEDKISEMIINNNIREGSVIRIEVVDNNIEVNLV